MFRVWDTASVCQYGVLILEMPHDDSAASSQSLERGLAILADSPPIARPSASANLPSDSASRGARRTVRATLARLGYLNQEESTRKYRLGIRALDLGFAVLGSLELRNIAAPHLQRLTATTGHT